MVASGRRRCVISPTIQLVPHSFRDAPPLWEAEGFGGPERPSEALRIAVLRRVGAAEGVASGGPRAGFAPAAVVARAVATLVVEAATHDAGPARAGAVAGTVEGVGRAVEGALARLVLDAAPPRALDGGARRGARRAEAGTFPARAGLPQAGWWAREDGEPGDGVGAAWPPVPVATGRAGAAPRGAVVGSDPELLERAWRALERELEPRARRVGGGAW